MNLAQTIELRVQPVEVDRRVSGSVREIAAWLTFPAAKQKNHPPSPLEEEIAALFRDCRSPLLRYTFSLGLSPQDGEDVVQEVFLALFHHLSEEKSRSNLRGWIFKVGHNLALKRRWKNGRRAETSLPGLGETGYADPSPNPEEQVALDRKQAKLWAVVQALPERDRCCLNLRAEGLRYREIAETLEMSLGAVSISLSRSLAKLSSAEEK